MKARWKVTLDAARDEAILAVDLYNQPKRPRRLEGFFIHMHLAWLYMFQAEYQRARKDYFRRTANGNFIRVDGEPKTWELGEFATACWDENHVIRKNLELTIALRNKIEHRYEAAIAVATAGYAQALLLNFETQLVDSFGSGASLGEELRFPVFIGSLTRDNAAQLAASKAVPVAVGRFLSEFESTVSDDIRGDQRYEFRVNLVQKVGPKTDADMALTYIRIEDLSETQRAALEQLSATGAVLVRDKMRDVSNANLMKPTEAARKIEAQIPFKFGVSSHFPRSWRALGARPSTGAKNPAQTKPELCVYDKPHNDYLYTDTFVKTVVTRTKTAKGFKDLVGIDPVEKPSAE